MGEIRFSCGPDPVAHTESWGNSSLVRVSTSHLILTSEITRQILSLSVRLAHLSSKLSNLDSACIHVGLLWSCSLDLSPTNPVLWSVQPFFLISKHDLPWTLPSLLGQICCIVLNKRFAPLFKASFGKAIPYRIKELLHDMKIVKLEQSPSQHLFGIQ